MLLSIFYAPTSVGLMGSPSSWTKFGWIALTSLFESKSANTGTDFFQKVIRYRMYGTCARFSGYSPSFSSSFLLAPAALTTYFLVPIIGVEVAKTDTSFLAFFSDFRDNCLSNVPSNSRWSTQFGRYLSRFSRPSWWCERLHRLQRSRGCNHFSHFGIENRLSFGLSCPSGFGGRKNAGVYY